MKEALDPPDNPKPYADTDSGNNALSILASKI